MATMNPRAKLATLDTLAELISKTSASADKKFTALAEDISGMKGEIAYIKKTIGDRGGLAPRTRVPSTLNKLGTSFGRLGGQLFKATVPARSKCRVNGAERRRFLFWEFGWRRRGGGVGAMG